MIVRELIELLEDCPEDAEIQLATQPSWPLRYNLAGVYDPSANDDPPRGHEEHEADWPGCPECDPLDARENVIWLVEGSQDRDNPYSVPSEAWDAAVRL